MTEEESFLLFDDPVAAAGIVVSDVAAELWASTSERHGFQAFAETAAPQLIRWESRHGWTRTGDGAVADKETSLAVVLSRMLRVPDTWIGFAEQYVRALVDTEDGLLDRIAGHAALGGAEHMFLCARLAHRRGNNDVARDLAAQCLRKLLGHKGFREFAAEIGVDPA